MGQNKIFSNSLFQIITALSLITGLLLLSFSGNPFTLLDPPEPDIETPEALEDQQLENNTFAERTQEQIQERDIEGPEQDLPNLENESFIDRMAMGLLDRLADTNQTMEDEEQEWEAEGTEEGDGNEENGEETDESGAEDSEQQEKEEEQQAEENDEEESAQEEQDTEETQGQEETEETGDESEQQEIENGSEDEETEQQGEEQAESEPDEPEEETEDEETEASGITDQIQENSKSILTALIVIATILAASIVYLSDIDIREISRTLLEKLKSFIKTLPDASQRILLNIINFAYNSITKIVGFAKDLATKPGQKTKEIIKTAKNCILSLKERIIDLKQKGIKSQTSELLGTNNKEYSGLMEAWITLKARAGLKGKSNYTPEEVREKAIDRKLPRKTVDKLVEIFRIDKYSSKEYNGAENVKDLKKELEGKDEQDR